MKKLLFLIAMAAFSANSLQSMKSTRRLSARSLLGRYTPRLLTTSIGFSYLSAVARLTGFSSSPSRFFSNSQMSSVSPKSWATNLFSPKPKELNREQNHILFNSAYKGHFEGLAQRAPHASKQQLNEALMVVGNIHCVDVELDKNIIEEMEKCAQKLIDHGASPYATHRINNPYNFLRPNYLSCNPALMPFWLQKGIEVSWSSPETNVALTQKQIEDYFPFHFKALKKAQWDAKFKAEQRIVDAASPIEKLAFYGKFAQTDNHSARIWLQEHLPFATQDQLDNAVKIAGRGLTHKLLDTSKEAVNGRRNVQEITKLLFENGARHGNNMQHAHPCVAPLFEAAGADVPDPANFDDYYRWGNHVAHFLYLSGNLDVHGDEQLIFRHPQEQPKEQDKLN